VWRLALQLRCNNGFDRPIGMRVIVMAATRGCRKGSVDAASSGRCSAETSTGSSLPTPLVASSARYHTGF
jgi:hypothetical protein